MADIPDNHFRGIEETGYGCAPARHRLTAFPVAGIFCRRVAANKNRGLAYGFLSAVSACQSQQTE
jgi:hypothetical protein